MTVKQAIEKGYTNKGEMFGFIPVYVKNDYDCFEAVGINKFWNFVLDIFTEVDLFLELGYMKPITNTVELAEKIISPT